ncbi:hypothetical protein GYMLUDRAFT_147667 [Collybiopsis luxurians FD-317 M1]|nr:hypothetical protein GYMLUDRAFT_147667 [Collybiopsis luxurians FD-317 M1]
MQSEIFQLSQLISTHIHSLVETCNSHNFATPSSQSSSVDQQFRQSPSADLSANIIVTAALQLITILTPRNELILNLLNSHYYTAALRVCLNLNIVEIIREGDAEGMHVQKIAEKCAIDEGKLERILRLLSLRHVFREGPPRVFSNNRLSEALDSGKSVHELREEPMNKHRDTSGEIAIAEGSKFSSCLLETLTDSKMKLSQEPNQTVFQYVTGTSVPFWEYMDQPENNYMRRRFNVAMKGYAINNDPEGAALKCVDWHSFDVGAKVVDVGGGIGSAMIPLSKSFPHLQFIIQDLPVVVHDGINFWNVQLPEAIKTKLVIFQSCNILDDQPIKDAAVFHLRRVLHNWSDSYAKRILHVLRKAATPRTKLVVAELLLHPTCPDPLNDGGKGVLGYKYNCAPEPLLANYGSTHEVSYMTDLTMLSLFNGQDRTLFDMHKLLEESGWRITCIYVNDERHLSHIVAEPHYYGLSFASAM